ncbi:hypothetical protein N7468_006706 [Penicillium chermesinum]|uniref:Uncharacterized protein n=1 Tax=Penicillium chermesinum TaxID=63820 RepID=A0A9W9NSQ4_9EURO|nr:uncharacterized protein N7468_006706 [Penicillium chermesinum]KAJ5225481.1 hypothetical protein N7468_006706 [Penicillium chermesinum]
MVRTFCSLRIGLMVGIGSGLPSATHDIRLGDIVIGSPEGPYGGVIQYDMGKVTTDGLFERTELLNSPPKALLDAVNQLTANTLSGHSLYQAYLQRAIGRNARTRENFVPHDAQSDRLFQTKHNHPMEARTCDDCPAEWEEFRSERYDSDPQFHYGIIASGNMIIKNGKARDQLAETTGALCYETATAGLMEDFPCLVIRGICDYADSHGYKSWAGYAALAAASYTKELLGCVPISRVSQEGLAVDMCAGLKKGITGSNWPLDDMLLDRGADVNTHDRLYGSALHAACIRGHSNVVQVLVDRGADIEGEHFESALQAACAGGHSNIVQILLDRGADIEGEHFKSALQAAITGGHFNIVQILVDRGADNNIQGGFYGSALHAACIRGHSDIVQLLVDRGADINIQGGFYGSALQAACAGGYSNIVRFLPDQGADINIQGGFYGSSLQAACAGGHSNIVQILLDRGADIEGEHFESALQAASTIGHRKLAQLLQEWKNDVTAQGENHGSVGCTLQTSIFDSANRSGATHPSTMPTSQPKAKLDTQVVSSLASSEQKVGLGIDQDDTIPSNIKPKSDIEEDSVLITVMQKPHTLLALPWITDHCFMFGLLPISSPVT